MTHYYEILGLQPGASKAEIKQAYRRLCLECHPDKLPPDTPKKARQIVEEHFKQINETYVYLMEHPSVYEPPRTSSESPTEEFSRYCLALHFCPARMQAIRCQLEAERERIEQQYQQKLERIHRCDRCRATTVPFFSWLSLLGFRELQPYPANDIFNTSTDCKSSPPILGRMCYYNESGIIHSV